MLYVCFCIFFLLFFCEVFIISLSFDLWFIFSVFSLYLCLFFFFYFVFFFFKQKTAYEMRISDWSSDVCSSDLLLARGSILAAAHDHTHAGGQSGFCLCADQFVALIVPGSPFAVPENPELGPGVGQHGGGNIAGVRAVLARLAILRAHADLLDLASALMNPDNCRSQCDLPLHVSFFSPVTRDRHR